MLTAANPASIARAAELIRAGECVAFPTETVYGLGADATNPRAVAKIFSIKDRPSFDPLIVHVATAAAVTELAVEVPDGARRVIDTYWPGPVTVVLPKRDIIPDLVTAGLPSVALRCPRHPVAEALLRECRRPVAAPSANPFGYVSPTTATHVEQQLGESIPLILDGGPCSVGIESTIVAFSDRRPTILRHGVVTRAQLEEIIGPVDEAAPDAPIQAPGQLPRHYAPRTPLQLVGSTTEVPAARRTGAALLSVGPVADTKGFARVEVLSATADLEEAAAGLFAALRRLDDCEIHHAYAIPPPEIGIGKAVSDRLRRAAAR